MQPSAPGPASSVVLATYWRLPSVLRMFLGLSLALLTIAALCELVSRFAWHLGEPYDSPLIHEYFPDVIDMRARYAYFHTLQFFYR